MEKTAKELLPLWNTGNKDYVITKIREQGRASKAILLTALIASLLDDSGRAELCRLLAAKDK